MIKPPELESDGPWGRWQCRRSDVWGVLSAAADGGTARLVQVLARDPNLYRAEYWYTPPLYFAVRGGHLEAVRILLERGADAGHVGLEGEDRVTTALDRGHVEVAHTIEAARERGAGPERPDHHEAILGAALHAAALDDDPPWATPLAWATRRGHAAIVAALEHA